MYRRLIVLLVALAFLAWQSQAEAALITIINDSFESPIDSSTNRGTPDGWVLTGTGGIWNINSYPYGFWNVPAPEGKQIGWLSEASPPDAPATFDQVLSDNLLANTSYSLTGWVGHPLGFGTTRGTIYTVELLAGDNILASISGTGPEGRFSRFTLTFDSTGSTFLGQPLKILLGSDRAQTGFDDLQLTAQAVPLPPSLLLLATGGLGLVGLGWRRRRDRNGT